MKIVGCVTVDLDRSAILLLGVLLGVVLGASVVLLSIVGAGGTFDSGLFVASGFSSMSGMSCFRPLLPDRIREMLG